MSETRDFHIGDILSVTTGRLVSPRHVDGIYDILNYMTGDNLFTHQLPRGMDECKPALLSQHPQLADVEVPDDFGGEQQVVEWLETQMAWLGRELPVAPLAAEDHTYMDPITELRKMAPHAEVIPIVVPGEDSDA
jgi:hypothetical protein